jgi:hypothetical protein
LHIFEEVASQALEDDDHMLSELEAVDHFDDAVLALVVDTVSSLQLFQYSNFNVCVVDIKLFVFADFYRHHFLVFVFHIFAPDNGAECACINL